MAVGGQRRTRRAGAAEADEGDDDKEETSAAPTTMRPMGKGEENVQENDEGERKGKGNWKNLVLEEIFKFSSS